MSDSKRDHREKEVHLDRWGTATVARDGVRRVMFQRAAGAGYLMITDEEDGVFDVWLETLDDVFNQISELGISWSDDP